MYIDIDFGMMDELVEGGVPVRSIAPVADILLQHLSMYIHVLPSDNYAMISLIACNP